MKEAYDIIDNFGSQEVEVRHHKPVLLCSRKVLVLVLKDTQGPSYKSLSSKILKDQVTSPCSCSFSQGHKV